MSEIVHWLFGITAIVTIAWTVALFVDLNSR